MRHRRWSRGRCTRVSPAGARRRRVRRSAAPRARLCTRARVGALVIEATGFNAGTGALEPPVPRTAAAFGHRARPRLQGAQGPVGVPGRLTLFSDIEYRRWPCSICLRSELQGIERGVLLFGPDNWDPALADAAHALAAKLGWPIVAGSGIGLACRLARRWRGHPWCGSMLRDAAVADALRPDRIVRFGGQPTSAAIVAWMARHPDADVWLVDPANGFRDPQHRANRWLRASSREFCELATSAAGQVTAPAAWLKQWQQADRVARAAADAAIDSELRFLTPHIARSLWRAARRRGALRCQQHGHPRGRPVRGPRRSLRVLANRGVNGIDGQVSAALGAAAALRRPTVLWCGDLALLHDVAGLLAGRMHGRDLAIVSNDDGGGIFEYLPAARLVSRPSSRNCSRCHTGSIFASWRAASAGTRSASIRPPRSPRRSSGALAGRATRHRGDGRSRREHRISRVDPPARARPTAADRPT